MEEERWLRRRRKADALAQTVDDLDLPGYRLHPLKGQLKGFWSMTVRANWRIIFRFEDGHTHDVQLIDYH